VLPRERDAVLGGRELLLDLEHVGVRLEVRVGLGQREELAQDAGEEVLRGRHLRRALLGILGRGDGGVARLDHRLERLALVLHVSLRRFDEVRNQVVTTLELDVDLRPGLLGDILEAYEAVIESDEPDRDDDQNDQRDPPTG
jgi:hypothetical protein